MRQLTIKKLKIRTLIFVWVWELLNKRNVSQFWWSWSKIVVCNVTVSAWTKNELRVFRKDLCKSFIEKNCRRLKHCTWSRGWNFLSYKMNLLLKYYLRLLYIEHIQHTRCKYFNLWELKFLNQRKVTSFETRVYQKPHLSLLEWCKA